MTRGENLASAARLRLTRRSRDTSVCVDVHNLDPGVIAVAQRGYAIRNKLPVPVRDLCGPVAAPSSGPTCASLRTRVFRASLHLRQSLWVRQLITYHWGVTLQGTLELCV